MHLSMVFASRAIDFDVRVRHPTKLQVSSHSSVPVYPLCSYIRPSSCLASPFCTWCIMELYYLHMHEISPMPYLCTHMPKLPCVPSRNAPKQQQHPRAPNAPPIPYRTILFHTVPPGTEAVIRKARGEKRDALGYAGAGLTTGVAMTFPIGESLVIHVLRFPQSSLLKHGET